MLVKLKRLAEGWFESSARSLLKAGLTPNMATIIGLALAAASAYLYFRGAESFTLTILASILLLASGFFDAVDGVMARVSGGGTKIGSLLDSVLDRYGDALVIFGITLGYIEVELLGLPMGFWGLAALFGSILVSYVRAKGESLGLTTAGIGFAERPERILLVAASGFFLRPDIGILIIAFLANLTAIQRFLYLLRNI